MEKQIGKVIEVFIPREYKNGRLIDIMESKKIGFKILIDDEVLELVEEQDEFNCNINIDVNCNRDNADICKRIFSTVGFNSLEYLYPEISREWDYKKNYPLTPDKIPAHTGKKSVHPVFSAYQYCFPQNTNPSDS